MTPEEWVAERRKLAQEARARRDRLPGCGPGPKMVVTTPDDTDKVCDLVEAVAAIFPYCQDRINDWACDVQEGGNPNSQDPEYEACCAIVAALAALTKGDSGE